MTQAAGVQVIFGSLTGDVLLDMLVGATFSILAYSSLAVVLLTAALAASKVIGIHVAMALVLGANLGSGVLAMLNTLRSAPEARRVTLGNFLFKLIGCLAIAPLLVYIEPLLASLDPVESRMVVHFHLLFNVTIAVAFLFFTEKIALLAERLMPAKPDADDPAKPRYLDPSALTTPALAIGCAAREALRIGDVIEQMLTGMLTVLKTNDRVLAERLRKMDDIVDELYTAIKLYLTQISREALEEKEGRRWTDIVSFTINMEQVGDIIERVITDVEEKKIEKGRSFSAAGMQEICDLHGRLVANLRLGMSVFLHGDLSSAQQLLAEKVMFRDLERAYAGSHIERLTSNTAQSIETSSLHLDLISDLKRINSHICSIAYPILEQAGVLAKTRLKEPLPAPPPDVVGVRPRRQARLAEAQAARRLGPVRVNACPRDGPDGSHAGRHSGGARRRLAARRLECAAQIVDRRRRAAGHRGGGRRFVAVRARAAGLRPPARSRCVAVHRGVDGDPFRLLPDARAGLPDRRSLVCLSADARQRAADRHGSGQHIPARAAERANDRRHPADFARHRQHCVRPARRCTPSAPRCRRVLGFRQRRDHRCLHAGRRRRRPGIRQCAGVRLLADRRRRHPFPRLGSWRGVAQQRFPTCAAAGAPDWAEARAACSRTASCSGR